MTFEDFHGIWMATYPILSLKFIFSVGFKKPWTLRDSAMSGLPRDPEASITAMELTPYQRPGIDWGGPKGRHGFTIPHALKSPCLPSGDLTYLWNITI